MLIRIGAVMACILVACATPAILTSSGPGPCGDNDQLGEPCGATCCHPSFYEHCGDYGKCVQDQIGPDPSFMGAKRDAGRD